MYQLVRLPCVPEDEGREDSYGTFTSREQAEFRLAEAVEMTGGYWNASDFVIREVR